MESSKVYALVSKIVNQIRNVGSGNVNLGLVVNDFMKVGVYNLIDQTKKAYRDFLVEFASYKADIGTFPTRG